MHGPPDGRYTIAGLVLFAVGAAWAIALCGGYFLADDFVQLANFGHWDATGRLAAEVASRFAASIDGVNAFFRPLTFASFALNYLVSGADAPAWLAVNLALHLANAVLVADLVTQLSASRTRAAMLGAFAGAIVFFTFSPGWEAALWIACRYDSLATFFTLLAGAAYVRGRALLAFGAVVAALLSKESGAVALVWMGLLSFARTGRIAPAASVSAHVRTLAPWAVLGIAYTLMRIVLFGSAVHVYRGLDVHLASAAHWRELVATGAQWAHQLFPGLGGVRALLGASAATLGLGYALAAGRDRAALLHQGLVLAALLVAGLLLLPHLRAFEVEGVGGRLFYQPAAFYAIAIGLAVHEAALALSRRPAAGALMLAVAALLIAVNVAWGWKAASEYRGVESEMRQLAAALGRLVRQGAANDYFLVLVPDVLERAPFARNAQAGLVLPPVQPSAISANVLVQTDREIPRLDETIDRGTLAVLRRHALFDLIEGRVGEGPWHRTLPSAWYCWSARRHALVPLAIDTDPGRISASAAAQYSMRCGASGTGSRGS